MCKTKPSILMSSTHIEMSKMGFSPGSILQSFHAVLFVYSLLVSTFTILLNCLPVGSILNFIPSLYSTEKSREVIPSLIEAAKKKPKGCKLNGEEVYKYLFTRSNLRLVQVGCHKKAARSKTISPESFYGEL